jgi:glucosamine-6-phosphate deaminase
MHVKPLFTLQADNLQVKVFADRCQMGLAAALQVAEEMKTITQNKSHVSIIFAAAPSQDEFLSVLSILDGLPWDRVIAFHMDEYVGISEDAPQSLRQYLKTHLLDRVKPGVVHLLQGEADNPQAECQRYARLLQAFPPDIVCAGIGENGHLAFNEPSEANFTDKEAVKIVTLDQQSRMQQVHDGCFPDLDSVPKQAFTLTIPALVAARTIVCVVPGPRKAQAVHRVLTGSITSDCPASILRVHPRAFLFLDRDSAALLGL